MASIGFRKGQCIAIEGVPFVISTRLPGDHYQLQNKDTGEWCRYTEGTLLELYASGKLIFTTESGGRYSIGKKTAQKLLTDLAAYPPALIARAKLRIEYLKEIDRGSLHGLSPVYLQPLIQSVSSRLNDPNPPSPSTLYRRYRRWISTGRDARAVIPQHDTCGNRRQRFSLETEGIVREAINQIYMAETRGTAPNVHLEIVRRINDENRFRSNNDKLIVPSLRKVYREIGKIAPYDVMKARYGKARADITYRTSMRGPTTSRALERVVMDHTPCDMIVIDDQSMLPLGRPNITSALDEHTRCILGLYVGFEPPSFLSVMRCLRHAILPKTYLGEQYPSIVNHWTCYGLPETVVVDNALEFHSTHLERVCLQLGCDIQYAKVKVPWYKGTVERFQGTMNRDLLHSLPGTTFSNILDRDDYDSSKNAVVMLSTLRELLHKWVVDVYMQSPHRGIGDTPAHKWLTETHFLPPLLPPTAKELDTYLGMTVQRKLLHYGVEIEGVRYNSEELGAIRRSKGQSVKIDATFDPGDLGHIHVVDPTTGDYITVFAIDYAYAKGLSLWQHKVIRGYSQRELNGRVDMVALSWAKTALREIVERDLNRKPKKLHKAHARFLEDHSKTISCGELREPLIGDGNVKLDASTSDLHSKPLAKAVNIGNSIVSKLFSDVSNDDLPVYETELTPSRIAPSNSPSGQTV